MKKFDFPKFDLHCHLDGAIVPETLFRLANERGIKLPADTVEGLTPFVVCDPDCRSVNEYLTKFELPTKILQDAAALETVAYELVKRLESQGLWYADIRFAPQLHGAKGLTQAEAIQAVHRGIKKALAECGRIKVGLIVCAMCLGTADVNCGANLETVRLAAEYHKKGVVDAFDLAGAEGLCPLSDFAELFDYANAHGVPLTCHAGDSQGPDTVETAMLLFHSNRIGHGHHIYDDPEITVKAVELGTTLEICLTSNIQCQVQPSYGEHPAKRLFDTGVKITLNTDNPIIAGVTLDDEYAHAMGDCGFSYNDLITMNINSANASFLSEGDKKTVIAQLESRYEH